MALAAAHLVACDDGRTYYPVKVCPKLCDGTAFGRSGHPYKRVAVALPAEHYKAIPAQQDVMLMTDIGITSLTKDQRLECRVGDQSNWRCEAPLARPGFTPERYQQYDMVDGSLSHDEVDLRPGQDLGLEESIFYTQWCHWKLVQWHDDTTDKDDKVASTTPPPPPLKVVVLGLVYWVTGCMPP